MVNQLLPCCFVLVLRVVLRVMCAAMWCWVRGPAARVVDGGSRIWASGGRRPGGEGGRRDRRAVWDEYVRVSAPVQKGMSWTS